MSTKTKTEQIAELTAALAESRRKFEFIATQLATVQSCEEGRAVLHSGNPLIELIRQARHTAVSGMSM